MFGFFKKKKKLLNWEPQLIIEVLKCFENNDYLHYINSIKDGILEDVRINENFKNFYTFKYNNILLNKYEILKQKEIEIENAQQAVSEWENYVYTIKSLHQNCTEEIDWNEIRNTDKPIQPEIKATNEDFAKFRLNTFKPSFFDKLFGSTQKKIDRLKLKLMAVYWLKTLIIVGLS